MSFAASPSSRIVAINRFDRGVVEISNFKGICAVIVSLDPRIRNLPMERNLAGDSTPTLKWKKVAYGGMQTGYDDSHTDESFLQQMVMNARFAQGDEKLRLNLSIHLHRCARRLGLGSTLSNHHHL
uniref:Uncharacterized protein n=1 Tax=Noccaea caerulescens TaxID=107243 RepID=A0A1J3GSM2_NOCCA